MTVLFQDTFTGSGLIFGHSPDTGFGSLVWRDEFNGDVSLSGGFATNTAGTPGTSGTAAYGWNGVDYSNGSDVLATFSFTTGTDVTPTASRGILGLSIIVGAVEITASIVGDGAAWKIYTYGSAGVAAAVTLVASTSYTGTLEIHDNLQTLTLLGSTDTSTLAYNDATGFSQVWINPWDDFKFDSFLVESALAAITGDVDAQLEFSASVSGIAAVVGTLDSSIVSASVTGIAAVFGDVSATIISAQAAGVVGRTGVVAATIVSASAAGVISNIGPAVATLSFSGVAVGIVPVMTELLSFALAFTAEASGTVPANGVAAGSIVFGASASGNNGVVGAVAANLPFFAITEAAVGRTGTVSGAFSFSGAGVGNLGNSGAIEAVFPISGAALGSTPMSYFGTVAGKVGFVAWARDPAPAVVEHC